MGFVVDVHVCVQKIIVRVVYILKFVFLFFVCVTFAFKAVVDDCNHDILVNSLCIASSLVMFGAGCVTGDLGIQVLDMDGYSQM